MKASLTESDYQLIQKLEIKRTEEQKEPLTALKIAKVLTQYHNNNDTNGQDNFELSTVNRVECDTEDIPKLVKREILGININQEALKKVIFTK